MTTSTTSRRWLLPVIALLLATAGFAATAGFLAGDRLGDRVRRRLARMRTVPPPPAWASMRVTDLPRYEFLRVPLGDSVLIFGGFHSRETLASRRVEILDLRTGRIARRRDMPVGITHTAPVLLRDTVWVAGGFEGDHPGPATARVWRYALATDEWSEGPPLPAPRGGGVLVARGDTLHFLGGWLPDRNTDSPDHWALVVGSDDWQRRAPLPEPRGHVAAVVLEGALQVVGGSVGHDPVPVDVPTVHRYDPTRDAWVAQPPLPFAVSHTEPSTVRYGDGILVVGGRGRPDGRENLDDILWYEPAVARWRQLGRTPRPMLGGMAVVRAETLHVGLGAARSNHPTDSSVHRRALRDAWYQLDSLPLPLGEVAGGIIGDSLVLVGEGNSATLLFDLARGRWLAPLAAAVRPAPGNHHAAEVLDGKLYLLGGLGGDAAGLVQVYDPATNRWSLRAPMPFAAGSSASAVIGGRIVVAGGIVGRLFRDQRTTDEVAIYDPGTNRWTPAAPMPRPRNHAASATDGARLYVFGGRGPGSGDANVVADGFDDVQVYDPATDHWTVSDGSPGAPMPLPQARGGTGKAVYLNGEFWVIGGETRRGAGATTSGVYARVDIYDPRANRWRRGPDLPTARHGIFPLLDHGRVLVAGGGTRAGFGQSTVFEALWARQGSGQSP